MLEALVCPVTHSLLEYNSENNELISSKAGLAFPIRDGIAIMLVEAARTINKA
ncbi:MAG: Trm112 family protein [Rhodobacterales bacterium]|nr:Trm112 family protein [Rhodobacterales bacterium]